MSYEELKRELSERSISQLPGLLQHVVRLCAIKPVFTNKGALLNFVDRAWDMGGVGITELRTEPVFEPKGIRFYSQSRKQEMLLVSDDAKAWAGWLCYRHPDGQWVSLRKATSEDRGELDNAIVQKHHE
jgi:hypothetical protein